MIDYLSMGKRIRLSRRNAGFTQEVLAEKINVTPPYISRIETGSAIPSLQTLVDICNALNITVDDLMQDSLPMAQKRMNGWLETILKDCTVAEMNLVANVVSVLLQEIRDMQKR